jgi:hypothetical protein
MRQEHPLASRDLRYISCVSLEHSPFPLRQYAASRIAQSLPEFSYLRKTEPCIQPDAEEVSSCEAAAYGMVSVLARKVLEAARWVT